MQTQTLGSINIMVIYANERAKFMKRIYNNWGNKRFSMKIGLRYIPLSIFKSLSISICNRNIIE